MAWINLDDAVMAHPKILRLSDRAFRAWVSGLCYCQQQLTDGWIPAEAAGIIGADPAIVAELYNVQLWEDDPERPDGWIVHDFLDYNQSKKEAKKIRKATRERVSRWRKSSKSLEKHAHTGEAEGGACNAVTNAFVPCDVMCCDVRTDQDLKKKEDQSSRSSSTEEVAKVTPRSSGRHRGRLFLHRWQIDALIDTLGPHADMFELDGWLDDLNRRIAAQALPRDPWKFVQAELHAEILTRGLAVALEAAPPSALDLAVAAFVKGGQ